VDAEDQLPPPRQAIAYQWARLTVRSRET
jgi:hypothetical protein